MDNSYTRIRAVFSCRVKSSTQTDLTMIFEQRVKYLDDPDTLLRDLFCAKIHEG